jgi:hypothetical protein
MIKDQIDAIFDKWWFNAALFGGVTVIMLLAGSKFLAGVALGMGLMYFIRIFRTQGEQKG